MEHRMNRQVKKVMETSDHTTGDTIGSSFHCFQVKFSSFLLLPTMIQRGTSEDVTSPARRFVFNMIRIRLRGRGARGPLASLTIIHIFLGITQRIHLV